MQSGQSILQGVTSVLLYGYGVEGQSTEQYLRKNYPSIRITIYDKNIEKYNKNRDPARYDLVVVSPGVDRSQIRNKERARLTSNTELFFHFLPVESRGKILAITGTKGKSTTVKFLYELLEFIGKKVAVGGNYGIGMLEILDELDALDFVVLELSSFQLEFLNDSPHYAGFVNFYEDHLDRHHSMEAYFAAKANIFRHQLAGDKLFIPQGYEKFLEPARSYLASAVQDPESNIIVCNPLPIEYFEEGSTTGLSHVRGNLGIAAEIVRVTCQDDPVIEQKIKDFSRQFIPLEHRLELVMTISGKRFVNDSQSTNQYSTIAGMEAFDERLGVLMLGGKDKGNRYELLVDQILKQHPFVILFDTEVGNKVQKLLEEKKYEHYAVVKNMGDAVQLGYQFTEPGKVCLMSPAAASFDWFKNYKDRGDTFKLYVKRLANTAEEIV